MSRAARTKITVPTCAPHAVRRSAVEQILDRGARVTAVVAGSGDDGTQVVEFTTVNRTRHQEDNFTQGSSVSDTLTSEGPMSQDGEVRGHFDLASTTTRVDPSGEYKVGNLVVSWDDGSQLVMITGSDFPTGGGPPSTIEPVVVGGSGRYFGTRGTCEIAFDGSTFDYRCRIVR